MRDWILLPLVSALLVAGCTTTEGGTEVEVDDDYFEVKGQPDTKNGNATAKVGETYHFENEGENPHTVTVHRPPDPASEYLLDETLGPGDETEFTFDQAGTYHVYCRFHGTFTGGMHLTVTVSA